MNVRKAKNEWDIAEVNKLCEKHGLQPPLFEYCLVCEDDAGNITGFANMLTIPTVDCFVADNPHVARKLYDSVVGGALATGQRAIQFYTKREDVAKLYGHLDCEIIGNDFTVARKEL